MKTLLALFLAAVFVTGCASKNNLQLVKTSGAAVAKIEIRPDLTPSLTGGGSASATYLSSPMVRPDTGQQDYTLVKTRGVCGNENYTSYMIVTEGKATASADGGASFAVGLNEGIYGGHVADYFGLAALASAMGSDTQGGDPSFTYDCSKVALPGGVMLPGPTGPLP